LPSSSAGAPSSAALNDYILDAIWSLDAALDDKEQQDSTHSTNEAASERTQITAATDRVTLADYVKQLLVKGIN